MSRKHVALTEHITLTYGNDHACGTFIQVDDQRFAGTGEDPQGEGYVLEWDELFGMTNNKIDIDEKLFSPVMNIMEIKPVIVALCDKFIKDLNKEDD